MESKKIFEEEKARGAQTMLLYLGSWGRKMSRKCQSRQEKKVMSTFDVYLLNAFFKGSSILGKLNNTIAHQVLFFYST